MNTLEASAQPLKKAKKRKSESLEEAPDSFDINTPMKKKKKKKKKIRVEEEELSHHPVDGLTLSPEKKRRVEEELGLHPAETLTQNPENKKEHRGQKKGEVEVMPKKDKKKNKQLSVTMVTTPPNVEGAPVSMETTFSSKKKKKKKKKKDGDFTHEEEKKRKLEKKKKMTTSNIEDVRRVTEQKIDLTLVDELQEFIPDVKKKSVSVILKLLRYDLQRFKDFKHEGLSLRHGRYSEQENQRIIINISNFLALTGISSVNELLFPQRFKEQEAAIKYLRAKHSFLERISEGIPRSCLQVYTRARKLFDDSSHVGRFSEEEMVTLRKLHTLHGNNWKAISEKMGRSIYSLQKRFATLDAGCGPWSFEEELQLKQAVRGHLETLVQQDSPGFGLSRDQLFNNLPWKNISLKVKTRSWAQCRIKWFTILKHRLSSNGSVFKRGPEGHQAKICLINTLYNMSVEDSADVQWDEVAQAVGKVTPMCVQKMFNRLKFQKVPNWGSLSYGEIIDFLHVHVVPYFQEKLKLSGGCTEPQVQQEEDRYHLSDIFEEPNEMDAG